MKVLILSHNCFSNQNNMGKTFLSLFSSFNCDELCQLYISSEVPNNDICANYYRISDIDVYKSYFGKKEYGGPISYNLNVNNDQNINQKKFGKKNQFKIILRDKMWNFSHWFSDDLKNWLISQKITHIFVAPGENKFFYDLSGKIISFLRVPVILYVCDDFYFSFQKKIGIKRLYYRGLRKKIRKLVSLSSLIVTICGSLTTKYESEFGGNYITIMTGYDYYKNKKVKRLTKKNDIVLSYFGNLGLGRFENIYNIGLVIDKINHDKNYNLTLNVYSNLYDEKLKSKLKSISCVNYYDFVYGKYYDKAKNDSDILIHTESFEIENFFRVKYSISTKIPECLLSNKVLFAFGPAGIASIDYLLENNCACVCVSFSKLYDDLLNLIQKKDFAAIIKVQNDIGKKNHISINNSKRLHEEISKIDGDKS